MHITELRVLNKGVQNAELRVLNKGVQNADSHTLNKSVPMQNSQSISPESRTIENVGTSIGSRNEVLDKRSCENQSNYPQNHVNSPENPLQDPLDIPQEMMAVTESLCHSQKRYHCSPKCRRFYHEHNGGSNIRRFEKT